MFAGNILYKIKAANRRLLLALGFLLFFLGSCFVFGLMRP